MMWALMALFSFASFANLDEAYVHRLARARSASQVRKLNENYERLRILRRACRLQVDQAAIPVACFETAQTEREWGLAPVNPELLLRLDELCARNARALSCSSRSSRRSRESEP